MIGSVKRLLPLVLGVFLGIGCGPSQGCPHGAEIVLRAIPQHGEAVTPAGMQLARDIINSRVDIMGVSSPSVTIRGSDEIVISGSSVSKRVAKIASVTGNLQFFDFEKDLAAPTVTNGKPTPYPTLYSLLATQGAVVPHGPPEAYYLFHARPPHRVLRGPTGTY